MIIAMTTSLGLVGCARDTSPPPATPGDSPPLPVSWAPQCFYGEMRSLAGPMVPKGWLPCDGRALAPDAHPELFAAIGYRYGRNGDRFLVPDARGRTIVGTGTGRGLSPRLLGASGGREHLRLRVEHLPAHSHSLAGHTTAVGNATKPGIPAASANEDRSYHTGPATEGTATGVAGNGEAFEIMPPWIGVNWIIYSGVSP